MASKRTFKLVVIANNTPWPSLRAKMDAVRAFYAPVCVLDISIVYTRLTPVFTTYPELAPLYVVDRNWYDVNIATPHALDADIVLFITPPSDHPNIPTYAGYMSFNNVGPWETTVFASGENDHLYMQGKDMGESFTLYACHELAHAFYYYCGKHDDTHIHFPVNQTPYIDDPKNVLVDFDFNAQYAILEYFKDKCIAMLTALRILNKKTLAVYPENRQVA